MIRISVVSFALGFCLLTARLAEAGPIVTSTITDLGGGVHAFDVYLDDPGSEAKSWFVDNFQFTGDIKQILFFGTKVSKEEDATNFNGIGGYSKPSDTWAGGAWVDIPSGGLVDTAGLFSITGGTGGGSTYTSVLLAHIVAGGTEIDYSGRISRYTVPNGLSVEGTFAVPEPATIVLLGTGGLALVVGAWRRRKSASALRS